MLPYRSYVKRCICGRARYIYIYMYEQCTFNEYIMYMNINVYQDLQGTFTCKCMKMHF